MPAGTREGRERPFTLASGDYRLVLDPVLGGSIAAFEYAGIPILRPSTGGSILDAAAFPLVPFANRIADGQFVFRGRTVRLRPNYPGRKHRHPLHGSGWLSPWRVIASDRASVTIAYSGGGDEWPWRFRAEQILSLSPDGLSHRLVLHNLDDLAMPAGLGFHPYIRRTPETFYLGRHCGEWFTSAEGLPISLDERESALDWWEGRPVDSRCVDTTYVSRDGPLIVEWRDIGMELILTPSSNLSFTAVYVPRGTDFFCIEPVSHIVDAVNSQAGGSGLTVLQPGQSMIAELDYEVRVGAS